MNLKALLSTGILASVLLAGAAGAQSVTLPNGTTINAPVAQAAAGAKLRGERGSFKNIAQVRRRLERLIDMLQRDRRDYGGHREKAPDLLQRPPAELLDAAQYDRAHPGP